MDKVDMTFVVSKSVRYLRFRLSAGQTRRIRGSSKTFQETGLSLTSCRTVDIFRLHITTTVTRLSSMVLTYDVPPYFFGKDRLWVKLTFSKITYLRGSYATTKGKLTVTGDKINIQKDVNTCTDVNLRHPLTNTLETQERIP